MRLTIRDASRLWSRNGAWRVAGRGSDLHLGHAEGTPPPNWSRQQTNPRPLTWGFIMERVTRIELALSAWEADVLPLNYTRVRCRSVTGVRTLRHSTPCRAPGAEARGLGRRLPFGDDRLVEVECLRLFGCSVCSVV